ncbi:gamma-glutamylcyclotransferase [Paracoccus aurantiacus]|uniref:glutathione-specific gamma-glutamylcyclotransferase n=1 Tax=Paracoccus aurantiacus TaxID=2599412 RepID=A0A5C6S7Z5_9RHOB|nr:gamma-glutamylcyclotransferase [Paracoccus aurantiacus]TXB70576.1 gamma-glutamylcyclotransferase [Paracoccus aurantiacus]
MKVDYWLFAYGSLMWDPGFAVAERVVGTLEGFHRSFCLRSIRYRGTPENPGLVLGLDEAEGASCRGVALRVAEQDWPEVIAAVRERELTTYAYREALLPVQLADGRRVDAITYVMQPGHEQYAGGLCSGEQARIIATASGGRGPNRDYLYNTAAHLAELGLSDPELDALADEVRKLCG